MPLRMLVDATDLAHWADRRDAQGRLPLLLRHLIHATASRIEHIGFPAEEAVQFGGWDGIVRVLTGNAFLPDGVSAWEMGTNRDVRTKANADYTKRRANPLGINPAETTFVFVTLRRWASKDTWVAERQAEGVWHEVRAYDADDLVAWLEQAPGVHLWLSIDLGKQPEGATALGTFWLDWSTVTRPPLSTELILARRHPEMERIHDWLRGDASAHPCV